MKTCRALTEDSVSIDFVRAHFEKESTTNLLRAVHNPDHSAQAIVALTTLLGERSIPAEEAASFRVNADELYVVPLNRRPSLEDALRRPKRWRRLYRAMQVCAGIMLVLAASFLVLGAVVEPSVSKVLNQAAAVALALCLVAFAPLIRAVLWMWPARILLLRPFGAQEVSAGLRKFIRRNVIFHGHVFTLADQYMKESLVVALWEMIPKSEFELFTLFDRRRRRMFIDKASRFRSLKRWLGRRFLLNSFWATSWDKIRKIQTTDPWWQRCIDLLGAACEVILVDLTVVKAGTRWELAKISQEKLETKVLCVVQEESFDAARAALSEHWPSENLPPIFSYDKNGVLKEPSMFAQRFAEIETLPRPTYAGRPKSHTLFFATLFGWIVPFWGIVCSVGLWDKATRAEGRLRGRLAGPLFTVVSLLTTFGFYFGVYSLKTDLKAARATDVGRIYDRPVTSLEFERSERFLTLADMIGLSLAQELLMGSSSETEMLVNFTFNRLVLAHEAKAFGIRPTPEEIVAFAKTLRPFQGPGGFDINKYTDFTQTVLPRLGFNDAQVEELISDQLSLNRVKDLLGSKVQFNESESREYYERAYGKLNVAIIRPLSEVFQKDVKITDDEIAKYYDAHRAQLKTEERRRVEFVAFVLSEPEKKLTGKERADVLQRLTNRATDLSQALLWKDANFEELANKFQGSVASTGEFTAATPDPKLASDPQLTEYAFVLTQREPYSDPIQVSDGFFILHLLAITEARPLDLEEAKAKIVEMLKSERVRQLVSTKGADTARVIREALNAGTPLDKAMAQLGLTVERIPPFSILENAPQKPEKDKELKVDATDLPMIKNAVRELNPGESTDFVPTAKGGLVAVVEKREPADAAGYAQAKVTFESNFIRAKRAILFSDWLRDRRQAAHLQVTMSQP